MYQTRHIPPVLCSYRQHVPVIPHGYNGVLQVLGNGGVVGHLVQLFLDALRCPPQVAADVHQFGGGTVGNFILGKDGVGNVLLHVPQAAEPLCPLAKVGRVVPVGDEGGSGGTAGTEQLRNAQQCLGTQGGSLIAQSQGRTHIPVADQGMTTKVGQHHIGFLSFLLPKEHFAHVLGGR